MVNLGRFFFSVAFHSYATSWNKAKKEQNPKLIAYTVPTEFFSLSRRLVAQGEISRHTALAVNDRFFFFFSFPFYSTSWHRAEVPDTLLNRSPTDFFFFFFFFFTPPRATEQKSSTHCSNGPHNYVARQTKPNTTVRPQRTLTKASRPTPLSRCNQRK